MGERLVSPLFRHQATPARHRRRRRVLAIECPPATEERGSSGVGVEVEAETERNASVVAR